MGPAELADLGSLFNSQRNTRHCRCMAFCVRRREFALGWLTGRNRERFTNLAAGAEEPMGVLASVAGLPIGWCACGPRSRYAAAISGPTAVLRDRRISEDDSVWLVPCVFVRRGYRGQGVSYALVRAAVELARHEGAAAIEGWPYAGADHQSGEAFQGREKVFADLGFRVVARPNPRRAIMRFELGAG